MIKIKGDSLAKLFLLAFVLVGALFVAVGCASGAASSREQPAASALSQDEKMAAPNAEREPTKTGNASPREATRPEAKEASTPKLQAKSVAEITASAPSSKFLDGRHLAVGQTCEGCHGALPAEGAPKPPDTAKCLSCHGGSDALAARTAALADRNPHNSHDGQLDCAKCHGVHKPFEYYCNTCHSFAIPKRFQSSP